MHLWKVAATRRRLIGLVTAFSMLAGAAGVAQAAASAEAEAEAVVQRLVAQVVQLLSSSGIDSDEGLQKLGRAIQAEADLDRLGRLVLGRHWREASENQRAEYQLLFRDLMLRKFAGHLGTYAGGDVGAAESAFRILGSQQVSEHDILVRSEVRPAEREPLQVSWRLRQRDASPAIIDVVVGGISLLVTQRSEFGTVIERQGMDGLLSELRARLDRTQS